MRYKPLYIELSVMKEDADRLDYELIKSGELTC